jgi:hypothetical protein
MRTSACNRINACGNALSSCPAAPYNPPLPHAIRPQAIRCPAVVIAAAPWFAWPFPANASPACGAAAAHAAAANARPSAALGNRCLPDGPSDPVVPVPMQCMAVPTLTNSFRKRRSVEPFIAPCFPFFCAMSCADFIVPCSTARPAAFSFVSAWRPVWPGAAVWPECVGTCLQFR